jgi:3-oxoacyl-[acyl-carrier-protein] synthase II
MENRRVVITGAGALTPLGNTVPELWDNLTRGACGVDLLTKFDTSDYKVKLAAEVKNFDPRNYFDSVTDIRRTDLYTQYAVAAAKEAVEDSGIIGKIDPNGLGFT